MKLSGLDGSKGELGLKTSYCNPHTHKHFIIKIKSQFLTLNLILCNISDVTLAINFLHYKRESQLCLTGVTFSSLITNIAQSESQQNQACLNCSSCTRYAAVQFRQAGNFWDFWPSEVVSDAILG